MADGHLNECKLCRDHYIKTWCEKNRERRRKISRESARKVTTPEKRAASFKRLLAKNPRYWNEAARRQYEKNPARILARDAAQRALRLHAIPEWADLDAIEAIYAQAQERMKREGIELHVDHVVPLKSKRVCGLHVQDNLRVISGQENRSKSNRHWPDMPVAA